MKNRRDPAQPTGAGFPPDANEFVGFPQEHHLQGTRFHLGGEPNPPICWDCG